MRYLSLSVILLSSIILNYGCTPRFSFSTYQPGTCIQETNLSYVSGTPGQIHLYKIEEYYSHNREYSLSIFYNNDWYYLKKKPHNYFKNSERFVYQEVQCPDGGDLKGLKFRLKGLKI